ncbi:SIMPL domain-containing protein [Bowmanella dokdonensis]|uniref:SIMPL domain-containing protein n=1 Tax=Bowmanella dokdonensis TaxID=751969 RepID=A0A939DKT5_9ALTE|nr:SIMPL domain-containing protein [Bowmanella dokdonensis]MBN7824390.1 SIMPL domain-containing protein [Bowmanella dokdonensis]
MKHWLLAMLLVISVPTLAADQRQVSVLGQASVSAVPDLFQFSLFIEERGPLVSKLNEIVSHKTANIVNFLLEQGVQERDIQSMHVQLHPWYEHRENGSEQKGFVLGRQIQVSLRKLELYDRVLDGVMKYGATRIDGFQLGFENQQDLYLNALENAVANAKLRAQRLAKSLDAKVGKVISVSEVSRYRPAPMMMEARKMSLDTVSMPGEVAMDAQVEVQFELNF